MFTLGVGKVCGAVQAQQTGDIRVAPGLKETGLPALDGGGKS